MTTASICRFALVLLVSMAVMLVDACSNKGKDRKQVVSEVAATVDSEVIFANQINLLQSRTESAGIWPQTSLEMRREALEKLIDQQLAANQAVGNKLHRLPEVVAQFEAARQEILTRAYVQQIASKLHKPTPEELGKYYQEHPQLFSERRIFNIHEIVLPTTPGMSQQLHGFVSSQRPIQEMAAWLKLKDIKFRSGTATWAAGQIPMELLAQIHNLKDGQSVFIEDPQAITLLRVASSYLLPITKTAALPLIQQFLINQRADEAIATDIKQLRANSRITYQGDFTKTEGSPAGDEKAKTPTGKSVAVLK